MVESGHTAFTRMPCGASSAPARASARARHLVVSYCLIPLHPITPYTEETFTIVPPPAARSARIAALTDRMCCQSCAVASAGCS